MEINLDLWPPNPKQDLFLRDHHKHVAFGGARGGGKSYGIRLKATYLALKHPGINMMIIRKTYPELMANHIRPLKELYKVGTEQAIATYNDGRKEMSYANGSTLLFGYCNAESDVDRYQGTEVDILFLDEATQLSEEQIRRLVACVRGVNNYPKRIYYTCNPGGKSHGYIKRLFIDRQYVEGEYADEYSFIQSLVTDNSALMQSNPEYVRQLEALPEQLKKAWLYGDWDTFVGQVFLNWRNDPAHYGDRLNTHVIDPFDIPETWQVLCTMDWGYTKPFAVVWAAFDQDRRMYLIREYYGCTSQPNTGIMQEPASVARTIRAIEEHDPNLTGRRVQRVGDPAIWGSQGTESIGAVMERERVVFERGDNARIDGLMQLQHRMVFDERGIPMFYVFNCCTHVIRTFPTLIYDERHVEDVDTSLEDHLYDAVRYGAMRYTVPPRPRRTPDPQAYDPLDISNNSYDRYDWIRRG